MQIRQITKKNDTKTVLTTLDVDGSPISNSQVLLIAKNNTHFLKSTDTNGQVEFLNIPVKTYTVFIAHPNYPAYIVEGYDLKKDLNITLKKSNDLGSLIIPDRTGYIPDLEGRLNPILDTSDRTYLYADNIAIEGGKNQPVTFVVGEPFTLEDRNGVLMSVTFIRIQGDSSILQYKKILVANEHVNGEESSESLSLYVSTIIPPESRSIDLKQNDTIVNTIGKFERLTNNQTFAIIFGGLLLLLAVYLIFMKTGIDLNDLTPEEAQQVTQIPSKIEANSLVVKGINHSEEGFSLVVPRGNSSSCVWTWVAGTGDIPGSETTNSTSGESNLHKLVTDLFNGRDFKVGCTNDYGEYYKGTFIDEPS